MKCVLVRDKRTWVANHQWLRHGFKRSVRGHSAGRRIFKKKKCLFISLINAWLAKRRKGVKWKWATNGGMNSDSMTASVRHFLFHWVSPCFTDVPLRKKKKITPELRVWNQTQLWVIESGLYTVPHTRGVLWHREEREAMEISLSRFWSHKYIESNYFLSKKPLSSLFPFQRETYIVCNSTGRLLGTPRSCIQLLGSRHADKPYLRFTLDKSICYMKKIRYERNK